MTLTQERIDQHFPNRSIRYYESVASSNTLATDWMREDAPVGACIIANEQTQGRGRKGRVWHTPPNTAIAMSYILRPSAGIAYRASMLGCLAVQHVLHEYGIDPQVKWPNDVLISGKKVCGVLPEAVWDGEQLVGVVLGIGINVRVEFESADLRQTATNIETELGYAVNRLDVLSILLTYLDERNFLADERIVTEWQASLSTIGQFISVPDSGIQGLAIAADTDGALLIETDSGERHRVIAGDIWTVRHHS